MSNFENMARAIDLQEHRHSLRLTSRQMAERLNLTTNELIRMERGVVAIPGDVMAKAEALEETL